MKLIVDDKIYFDPTWFNRSDLTIERLPTLDITNNNTKEADALWVRSITAVNKALLENTNIKFIGSATSGDDHLDIDYLKKNNIAYCTTPGANKEAVVEYVLGCLRHLTKKSQIKKIGIIGCGRIGSLLKTYLEKLNYDMIVNDPPRALLEDSFISTPLDNFFACDVICLHTPLTHNSDHPTYHLINNSFLKEMKKNSVLINAARGSVVDTKALLNNQHVTACLDVYENEPDIDLDIVKHCYISTPHIAGYSLAAKQNAAKELTIKTCQFFNISTSTTIETVYDKPTSDYNPLHDSTQMKNALKNVAQNDIAITFRNLRRSYKLRS